MIRPFIEQGKERLPSPRWRTTPFIFTPDRKEMYLPTPSNKIGGVMLVVLVVAILWYLLKGK